MEERRSGTGRRDDDRRWEWVSEKLTAVHREIDVLKTALMGDNILEPEKGLISRVRRLELAEISRAASRTANAALIGSLLLFLGTLSTAVVSNVDRIKRVFKSPPPWAQVESTIDRAARDPQLRELMREKYGINP